MQSASTSTTIDKFAEDWPEIAWAKLPVELRQRAVDHLREIYQPPFWDEVRALIEKNGPHKWLPRFWHFGQGMAVRNDLRQVIKDEELPGLPEVYGEDYGGNWDDYYIQCIEAAAGTRAIESTDNG